VTTCQLETHPSAYDHKLVEVRGRVYFGKFDFVIDSTCKPHGHGLSGGGEEPQESQQLVNVERESAFDFKQIQMVSLSGQSTMHTKMFASSKAGRTAVIAACVACPVGLGQTMQAEIDAAIQRTSEHSILRVEHALQLLKSDTPSLNESQRRGRLRRYSLLGCATKCHARVIPPRRIHSAGVRGVSIHAGKGWLLRVEFVSPEAR
jgi:hypothetical protein